MDSTRSWDRHHLGTCSFAFDFNVSAPAVTAGFDQSALKTFERDAGAAGYGSDTFVLEVEVMLRPLSVQLELLKPGDERSDRSVFWC